MQKHSRVAFFLAACLAGVIGQVAAFGQTTNSVWDATAISSFKVGKLKAAQTNSGSAVFLSDGTCNFLFGDNEIAATYTNTMKGLTVTLGDAGLVALESNTVDFLSGFVPSEVVLTVKSVKAAKIKLSKTGVPVAEAYKISCVGTETVGNKSKSKSVSVSTVVVDWALESGTTF